MVGTSYIGKPLRTAVRFTRTTLTQIGTPPPVQFTQTMVGATGLIGVDVTVLDPLGVTVEAGHATEYGTDGMYGFSAAPGGIVLDGLYQVTFTTTDLTVDSQTLTEFVYVDPLISYVSASPQAGGLTLSTIVARAQRRVDQNVLQPTGKWSYAWWVDHVNTAQSILAQRTGYKRAKHYIPFYAGSQVSQLPMSLCKGNRSLSIGSRLIPIMDESNLTARKPGWRYNPELPNQPQDDGITVESTSANDAADVRLYGTTVATGAYAYDPVTLPAAANTHVDSAKLDWGELRYALLSAECDGDVTIREASGGLVIAVISAGDLSCGLNTETGTPTAACVTPPNLEWYPVPDIDGTAVMIGGAQPQEFTTGTDAQPDSLPAVFHWLLSEGAAMLASGSDLYTSSQQAQQATEVNAWERGCIELERYVGSLSQDRGQTPQVGGRTDYGGYDGMNYSDTIIPAP
jgi:hypothetical protein